MNVLVTGAAGFIGSHIMDSLVRHGHYVVGVDDCSGGDWSNVESGGRSVEEANVDCGDNAEMLGILDAVSVDVLVHCAANAREGASQFQPHSVTQRNLAAYMSVLSAAITCRVKNVCLFSSMAVYGAQTPPFEEDLPTAPEDVYAVNKVAMEQATRILAQVHDLNYIIIRPHNVFGERQCLGDKMRNVVAIFMNRIMRDEPLFIYGDGEQKRAFSYIKDSLPCFVRAVEEIETLGDGGQIINVGGIQEITVNELAAAVKAAMGVPQSYATEHIPDRPCEVKNAFSTYTKSVGVLGYDECVGWRSGLAKMAAWAKEKGPQPWLEADPLEIVTDKTPAPWLEK